MIRPPINFLLVSASAIAGTTVGGTVAAPARRVRRAGAGAGRVGVATELTGPVGAGPSVTPIAGPAPAPARRGRVSRIARFLR